MDQGLTQQGSALVDLSLALALGIREASYEAVYEAVGTAADEVVRVSAHEAVGVAVDEAVGLIVEESVEDAVLAKPLGEPALLAAMEILR